MSIRFLSFVVLALVALAATPARAQPGTRAYGTVTQPAAAAPGSLVVTADADGLVLEIRDAGADSRVIGLKAGENRVDLAAGTVHVVVRTAGGQVLNDDNVAVPAGGEARLSVIGQGQVRVEAPEGAAVTLDGNPVARKDGVHATAAVAGAHSLVVTHPGRYGQKGALEVAAGRTAAVKADLQPYDVAGPIPTVAWVAVLGGGALLLTGVALDALFEANEVGGDATRWALVGVGTAGFVGGTVALKRSMDAVGEPPVRDGTWQVQVSRLRRDGAAVQVGLKF
jgi:hypothetical protein